MPNVCIYTNISLILSLLKPDYKEEEKECKFLIQKHFHKKGYLYFESRFSFRVKS